MGRLLDARGLTPAPTKVTHTRLLLSRNYDDFQKLHDLIHEAKGRHPGVLIVRFEVPKRRFLRAHEVVRALRKLEIAGTPIVDDYTILNHWQ
jgi:hypothetical protein